MRADIRTQTRFYRRGMILGLSMAETVILIIFVLLLTLAAIVTYKDKQIAELTRTVKSQETHVAELAEQINILLPKSDEQNKFDDLFRELRLAKQETDKAIQRAAALEEQVKTTTQIVGQLITPNMAAASLEQKVAWLNERVQLAEEVRQLLPQASSGNQLNDVFRELRLAKQEADKAKQRAAELEKQTKMIAPLVEQLATAHMAAASPAQKVAWLNERVRFAEEVRQLFPTASRGNQFDNLLRELRVVKQEIDKAKKLDGPGQRVGGHDQPPRISLKESDGYSFPLGSAELSGPFRMRLSSDIVTQILSIAEQYQVSVVEVIGHTDETPLRRTGGTLDGQLILFLRGEDVPVVATDNVGLGMARAAAVLNALAGDPRLSHLMFLPYSAGQVVLRGDRLSDGTDRSPNDERRRIEISLRKPR